MKVYNPITLAICLFALTACGGGGKRRAMVIESANSAKSAAAAELNAFVKTLVPRRILDGKFSVSIPVGYTINDVQGEDFAVYYIEPEADSVKRAFAAGIYFGGHPSLFSEADSVRTTTERRLILGKNAKWTLWRDSVYNIETLIRHRNDEYWRDYIHVFGEARTESDREKLFAIFGTLAEYTLPFHSVDSIGLKLIGRERMDDLLGNLRAGDNLLFTDLYPLLDTLPVAGDDHFHLKERLPLFGFELVENSEGRGNWERGPRFLYAEYEKGTLRCAVRKCYQTFERGIDDNYNLIVYEQIVCRDMEE